MEINFLAEIHFRYTLPALPPTNDVYTISVLSPFLIKEAIFCNSAIAHGRSWYIVIISQLRSVVWPDVKPELLTCRLIQNCVKELDVIAVVYGYYTTANNQSNHLIWAIRFITWYIIRTATWIVFMWVYWLKEVLYLCRVDITLWNQRPENLSWWFARYVN